MSDPTRGEWNNNPLNLNFITNSRLAWTGQIGIEIVQPGHSYTPRFGRYDTPFHGIRAGAKQLVKDNTAHGLKTITQLVGDIHYGWAPAVDNNNVGAYVARVCSTMGHALGHAVGTEDKIDLSDIKQLYAIWPGFCLVENVRCIYEDSLILAACRDALGLTPVV